MRLCQEIVIKFEIWFNYPSFLLFIHILDAIRPKATPSGQKMISFSYNFFFFSSNHALLSSKKTEKSTKNGFQNFFGTFAA